MTPLALQAWRSRMGWTAKEAAAHLGLSQNGYAAYGHRGKPMTECPSLTDEQLRQWRDHYATDTRIHVTITELLALRAERAKLEAALRQFADLANWEIANLRWTGKRHAIEYAQSVLDALAQPAESGATFRPSVERALQRCADLDTEPTGAKP